MRDLLSFNPEMTYNDVVEYSYSYYIDNLIATYDTRLKLKTKSIHIYEEPTVNNKPEMFWHLIGWEKKQVINVKKYNFCKDQPDWKTICGNNCSSLLGQVITPHFGERTICLQRMTMIPRILDVIELVNEDKLENITMWDYTSRNGKHKNEQLYLRYRKGIEDYVVIFQYMIDPKTCFLKKVLLFGAFPVVFKYKRDELEEMEKHFKGTPKIKQVLSI